MRSLKLLVLGGLLAAASSAAVAFQEQQQGGAGASDKSSAPSAVPATPSANFSQSAAPAGKGGTEIRIPGLGLLGVLPKMDFGLELLYGAAESKLPDDSRAVAPNGDDLQIKGTLRRRF